MPRERKYYVYIRASVSGTLYVGVTNNIYLRVTEHKKAEGSRFTSKHRVNRLVHFEVFQYIDRAIARETEIKGWRRSKKIALIELANPSWQDVSKDFGGQFRPENVSRE
jgi:putative endonuclease